MNQENIDDMFSQMLGELDDLTQQLNVATVDHSNSDDGFSSNVSPEHSNEVADFDEEDVNLTAILNDLTAIEENINKSEENLDQLNEEQFQDRSSPQTDLSPAANSIDSSSTASHVEIFPEPVQTPPPASPVVEMTTNLNNKKTVFSELQSLENNIQKTVIIDSQEADQKSLSSLSQEDSDDQAKSEKVRIALEKLREARILKLVVKVYNKDSSSKTMMIDERMTTRTVLLQLVEKNHYDFSAAWSLIEEMPDLYLERMFEEHEKPCETMRHWTRDSTNRIRFTERKDKYALFKNPQHFLLPMSEMKEQLQEQQKQILIEDFFSESGPSSCVPEVEGYLHIRNGKSWSRKYCVLRSSGLYISKNGEPKKGKKLTDLTFLVAFEQNLLYLGRGWKKKFKSPFEYGFALKNPTIQMKSKHIRYIACEDFKSLMRWTIGIRLAKYGRLLLESYRKTNEEMKAHSSLPIMNYQPDSISLKSSDSGDASSRSGTLPRHVDIKNMFEGAWPRGSQMEKSDKLGFERSTIPRSKTSLRSSQKKSGNWWEMQDSGQGSSESNLDEISCASADDLRAADRTPLSSNDRTLPPPPSNDFDFPPPPSLDDLRRAQVKPPPPPKSTKPNYKHVINDQSLPPPPPMMSHDKGVQNGNVIKPPPPAVLPKRVGSQSSLKGRACDELPPPPPPINGAIPPLSSYYMGGGGTCVVDDFPPPPPFVLDLKESFVAVTGPENKDRRKSVDETPRPSKLIAYIKCQTLSRLQGNRIKTKKVPPAPPRISQTRLSSKRR